MIDPLKLENASEEVKALFEKYQDELMGRKPGSENQEEVRPIKHDSGVISIPISSTFGIPLGDLWTTAASLTLATIILTKDK